MKKLLFILLLLFPLTACQSKAATQYSSTTLDAGFDTPISLYGYAQSQEAFDEYFALMVEEFQIYNRYYDKYNSYEDIANIKTINDNAGIAPVKVDKVIIDLLLEAKKYYEISDGAFDITMGAVLDVWHQYREAAILNNEFSRIGDIPTLEELQDADQYTGWQYLEIDEVNSTVYINNSNTRIDVGGIAKGYATELVARTLEAEGITSAAINAGGNVRTIGVKADNTPWGIGIAMPIYGSSQTIDVLRIPESMAIVTSGVYQRFFIGTDGVTYHHIINPETLYPINYFESVTVITADSGIADALTKSIIMKTYEKGSAFVEQYNLDHPEAAIQVIWVAKDSSDTEYGDWELVNGYRINMSESLKPYSDLFK